MAGGGDAKICSTLKDAGDAGACAKSFASCDELSGNQKTDCLENISSCVDQYNAGKTPLTLKLPGGREMNAASLRSCLSLSFLAPRTFGARKKMDAGDLQPAPPHSTVIASIRMPSSRAGAPDTAARDAKPILKTVSPKGAQKSPSQRVLELVNQYRRQAGLEPVALNPELSKGCMEHAEYMRLNYGTAAMQGLNAHKQDPSLPGATPEGAECGRNADLSLGHPDLETAVHKWMATLYHRRPILKPSLRQIGVGYSLLKDGGYASALMLVDGKDADAHWPVAYPARDQVDVSLEYDGGEIPNPIPGGGTGGYPITLQFPEFDSVTQISATLTMEDGRPVPFYLSSPKHPATTFGQYGVVCLVPKQVLHPQTRYEVSIQAKWKGEVRDVRWSFTTLGLRKIDATDEAQLGQALGQPSLVRGTVSYVGMLRTDTIFLSIGNKSGGRYKTVAVLVPVKLWRVIGRGADPKTMNGKTIEVQAVPDLVKGVYLSLPLSEADHLRIMPGP
ncbi:MAG: CAP domain-containing protein [Pseudomonadota bacterium]